MRKLVLFIIVLVLLIGCSPPTSKLESRNWVSPGKVWISNYYPGARAEYAIVLHNGNLEDAVFDVNYRASSSPLEGYTSIDASSWVIITDSSVVLKGRETRKVLIVLEVPKGTEVVVKKWEFWIGTSERFPGAQVVAENGVRFLVSMK